MKIRRFLIVATVTAGMMYLWGCGGSLQTDAADSRNAQPRTVGTGELGVSEISETRLPEECGNLPPLETPDTAVTVRCSCRAGDVVARWVASKRVPGQDGSFCTTNLLYGWQVVRVKAAIGVGIQQDAGTAPPVVSASPPVPVTVASATVAPPPPPPPPVASATASSMLVEYTCNINATTQIAKREMVKDGQRTEIQRCAGPDIACVEKDKRQDVNVPPCACLNKKTLVQAPANVWSCQ